MPFEKQINIVACILYKLYRESALRVEFNEHNGINNNVNFNNVNINNINNVNINNNVNLLLWGHLFNAALRET